METISVIIVTFNTRELALRAIQSVYDSVDDCQKEVIVVDNGSIDGTEGAVRSRFPQVKYHFSKVNLGFARANNVGANSASGEWILLLNSDACLKSESLGIAIAYMRCNPKCGVLGAQLLNEDGSFQNSIANCPTLATELLNKSLLRRLMPERFPGKEHRATGPIEVESVIGAFLLTRRPLWEKLGGLDERFFFFLEETDFCLEVRKAGWSVIHHPEVQVWHYQGGSAKQVKAAARIEYWRSRYQYFQKHAATSEQAFLLLGLSVRLAINWLLNGAAAMLTMGRARGIRARFKLTHALIRWHLAGRPDGWGIPRADASKSSSLTR